MRARRIRALAEAAAEDLYPDAEEIDVYLDLGRWRVSVFGSSEHEGERIHAVKIHGDHVELYPVS